MCCLVSLIQSAFVPGWLIIDNALIAYELMHYFKHKRSGKKRYMSLKLNMSKTYDRVSWIFLEEIMRKMGLEENLDCGMCYNSYIFGPY